MDQLTKDDLAQIDRTYLQSLEEEQVIDVACKLRDFAVILVERLEQNSSNSSRPPSSDSPYDKGNDDKSDSKDDDDKSSSAEDEENTATENGASMENSVVFQFSCQTSSRRLFAIFPEFRSKINLLFAFKAIFPSS